MVSIRKNSPGVIFKVLVQPRSSKNMLAGIHNDALKIKLIAPPVNNAANRMSIEFLAKALGVPKSSLEIVSGHIRNKFSQVDRNPLTNHFRSVKSITCKKLMRGGAVW